VCCRSHPERLEEPGRDKLGERLTRVACYNKCGNVVVLNPHISRGTKRAERRKYQVAVRPILPQFPCSTQMRHLPEQSVRRILARVGKVVSSAWLATTA
jgi:hypothetical protein